MSLSSVYQALRASIRGDDTIDLYDAAARHDALKPLQGILGLFRIGAAFVLREVTLPEPTTRLVLGAKGSWSAGGVKQLDVGATLTVTEAAEGDRFLLELAPPAKQQDGNPWTFDAIFSDLPDSAVAEGVMVPFEKSFLIGMRVDAPAFSAGNEPDAFLHFGGQLPRSGALDDYADLFAPWPLRLDGEVKPATAPGAPAELDLVAVQSLLNMSLLGASLTDVGAQLLVQPVSPPIFGRTALSSLNLVGELGFGASVSGRMSVQLLASEKLWRLMATFPKKEITLVGGLQLIADLMQLDASQLNLPESFPLLDLSITEIEIGVTPMSTPLSRPSVQHVAVTVETSSDKPWKAPVPYVSVADFGARWLLTFPAKTLGPYMSGAVFGTIHFGEQLGITAAEVDPDIEVSAALPQFVISGKLVPGAVIEIDSLIAFFYGQPPPFNTKLKVNRLEMQADLREQSYDAVAEITTPWSIELADKLSLDLTGLEFHISVSQGGVSGGIIGLFTMPGAQPDGMPDPQFDLSADYEAHSQGWSFAGQLYPSSTVSLKSMAVKFLELDAADVGQVPDLQIEALSLRFTTQPKRYALSGRAVLRWQVRLFDQDLPLSLAASADIVKNQDAAPEGTLSGQFTVNNVAVTAGINLKAKQNTYFFRVDFDGKWLAATTAWHSTKDCPAHQVISLQLGGVTLGDMLTYLVNLAAPTLGFQLEAPWDLLERIELSRFTLTVDPDPCCASVSLSYAAGLQFVAGRIDKVTVRYSRVRGESAVDLLLEGDVLGKKYTEDKPLAWDVVNEPPPSIPGKGSSLLDLRYVGLGQRVRFSGDLPKTVAEAVARLRKDMQPPKSFDENPLKQGVSTLRFAADSQWLIGLDATVMDTVAVGIVFNDPLIYGLSVGLNGERAGSFAGLRFELLYKKITDDIGMFRVELQLPTAFRRIELGAVSVTLGIIVVEVYTNGNFMVDLGFPYNRDYTRSFTVQAFPLIGRGGVYFGLLSGATSSRVPRISNGTFSPVLELGVGLAVGVGKEVSVGPLSGGAFVEVEVIFQGVLAWFNPTSAGTAPAEYYWAQGIVALHGKVYGKIDFKIIKVSVTIEAWAQATVVFEAYRAILFRLNVGVSVRAEVDVLFFTVTFTFRATLDVGLTVGSDRPTPWLLASGAGGAGAPARRALRAPLRRVEAMRVQHVMAMRAQGLLAAESPVRPGAEEYQLDWDATRRFFGEQGHTVPITMLPAFSVQDAATDWTPVAANAAPPSYRVGFVLMAPNGVRPRSSLAERGVRSVDMSTHAGDEQELSAHMLIDGLLRWSISAVTRSLAGAVTAGQLHLLAEQMDMPQTEEQGFTWDKLATFFAGNLKLLVSGQPAPSPSGVGAAQQGGMAFPVPPALTMASPQLPDDEKSRDFAGYNGVGPWYEWGCAEYLNRFFPQPAPPRPRPDHDVPADYESMATYVYRDWCLMVAKQAVQSARDTMSGWSHVVKTAVSLEDVAGAFPKAELPYAVRGGDTVDSVAAAVGATPAELEWLDPGLAARLAAAKPAEVIKVTLGVSPEAVAVDNQDVSIAAGVPVTVPVQYQVRADDTLQRIATHLALQGGAAALFDGTGLAEDRSLLRVDAGFDMPQRTVPAPAGFSELQIAALYYDRYAVPDTPLLSWYAQAILDLNPARLARYDAVMPIPLGTEIDVPQSAANREPTRRYVTQPGDTVGRVAAALDLAQNHADDSDETLLPHWAAFRAAVKLAGTTATIPSSATSGVRVVVQPAETVDMLAARLLAGVDASTPLAGVLGWIATLTLLSPLAVVDLPAVTVNTGNNLDTLAKLATHLGHSVEALAALVTDKGLKLFAGGDDKPLTLTLAHLVVQDVDTLVRAVLAGHTPTDIAGMSSRHLLAGLRLPELAHDGDHVVVGTKLEALYSLTGQQFPAPAVLSPPPPDDVALQVTVSVDDAAKSWITLASTAVVGPTENRALLAARHDDLDALNPALRLREPQPGMVVHTATAGELVYTFSSEQLAKAYPATTLQVRPVGAPAPMPLAGETPLTYGLDHHIELQSPLALPVPNPGGSPPLTGNGALWPLSEALRAKARAGVATPYDIVRVSSRVDSTPPLGPQPETLGDATFACAIPFGVRRVEGRAHVYELLGVSTSDREALLQVWQYLRTHPTGNRALLMLAPVPGSGNPTGLQVLTAADAATFLVKTNLSTETTPGMFGRAEDGATPSQYFADFADLQRFLLLLWEGSVVAGGYWFGFATADGQDLPQGAFDNRGVAQLRLLFVAGEQLAVAPSGRSLLPFNTAAITGPGLDPGTTALYVEAHDDSELVQQALVPAGSVGFTLTTQQPPPDLPAPPEVRLRQLFSMVTYGVDGGSFPMGEVGVPVTPQQPDGDATEPLWRKARRRRWARAAGEVEAAADEVAEWWFHQVLPITRFGPASAAPAVPGLPAGADDPYRGIGDGAIQIAAIRLGFADVLGNTTAPSVGAQSEERS